MSIGKYPSFPSDSSYPDYVLSALTNVRQWLRDEKNDAGEESLHKLSRLLDEMADEEPFSPDFFPHFRFREPFSPFAKEEEYKYRRPVWDLIATQVDALSTKELPLLKEKARWLQGQIKLCLKYREYESAREVFSKMLKRHGISFCVCPPGIVPEEDVFVTANFEHQAITSWKILTSLVDALIPALTNMLLRK